MNVFLEFLRCKNNKICIFLCMDRPPYLKIIFLVSTKQFVVGTQKKRLIETVSFVHQKKCKI